METTGKIEQLARKEKIFAGVWIAATIATLLLLVAAMMLDISWGWALLAFIVSTAAKWIGRHFNRKKSWSAYRQAMLERGFSEEEAHKHWEMAYYGGPDKLGELRQAEAAKGGSENAPQQH